MHTKPTNEKRLGVMTTENSAMTQAFGQGACSARGCNVKPVVTFVCACEMVWGICGIHLDYCKYLQLCCFLNKKCIECKIIPTSKPGDSPETKMIEIPVPGNVTTLPVCTSCVIRRCSTYKNLVPKAQLAKKLCVTTESERCDICSKTPDDEIESICRPKRIVCLECVTEKFASTIQQGLLEVQSYMERLNDEIQAEQTGQHEAMDS